MEQRDHDKESAGPTRRRLLECAPWAGAGVVWGLAGGVPYALGLLSEAMAQPGVASSADGFTFVQISDSHIGFATPVNPDARGTLTEVVTRVAAMPAKPAFMIHTGDITHLSKPREFDDAAQIIGQAGLTTHFIPGEHDLLDPEMSIYHERYGAGTKGAGWYSFDVGGVHFIALVNVDMSGRDLGEVYIDDPGPKAGGLGLLGEDQLAWIEDDLHWRGASTPIVVMAHVPLWAGPPIDAKRYGFDEVAEAIATIARGEHFGKICIGF